MIEMVPSNDDLRAVAMRNPTVALHGIPSDLHAADYVIRLYREHPLRALVDALQWLYREDLCIVIRGSSGTLRVTASGSEWIPKPTLVSKAARASKAAATAAAALFTTGSVHSSDAEVISRRAVCKECPHFGGYATMACDVCGCNMRLKTTLKTERCPLGKW